MSDTSSIAMGWTMPPVAKEGQSTVRVDGGGHSFSVSGLENGRTYSLRQIYQLAKEQGVLPEGLR